MEGRNATFPDGAPPGWVVRRVDVTGSTNADLMAAGFAGAPHRSVLVADHQTAGRGRLDRTWEAPPGANLLVSILLRDGLDTLQAATQRVAVAAARACEQVAGVVPELKWPNDLLLDGRKLAGILAQVGMVDGAPAFVVVGLGLNIGWAPHGAARLPVGDRDRVLAAVLAALDALPADVTDEYRARLGTTGRQVRVEVAGETFVGRAIGVDDAGRLVVDTPRGRRVVDAGDVVHIRSGVE